MFNWQQRGWPKATVNRAALKDELDAFKIALRGAKKFLGKPQEPEAVGAVVAMNGGLQTRYRLNIALADGAIEPLNAKLLRIVGTHPGTNLQYLTSAVTVSRATVKRAVAALVAAGKIEHRGSKKTGGYYAKDAKSSPGFSPRSARRPGGVWSSSYPGARGTP